MQTTGTSGRAISLTNISKSWDGVKAVDNVNIEVPAGTFTVLLGPSGCGKSTTLRIIAGLEFADEGTATIGERDVTNTPPVKRDIAMVFQSYALFPHLTVAENILFGLKVRRVDRRQQNARLQATATMLGLEDYLHRKPSQLSGGQQQRVALGRAIIADKPVCLMDEPLSNLDARLRNSMRTEIRDLQQSLGFSMVYVTHDQAEAITMADQVIVMCQGRVEQSGTPRDIYQRPASTFVAGFIGTPPMNLINCDGLSALTSVDTNSTSHIVGVRPEDVIVSTSQGIAASVEHVEYMGADLLADCRIDDQPVLARVSGATRLQRGQTTYLSWASDAMHFFDAGSGKRLEQTPPDLESSLVQLTQAQH